MEKIVGVKFPHSKVKKEYLVKWRGWDEPTWEPSELIEKEHLNHLIEDYL